ncbi:MAG: (Fe-S)-binding protein [Thermodesulforhabdaceae bacterium]
MPNHKTSKIISMLQNLENDLSICMRCGMCQSVFSIYRETHREPDVARGKIILLDALKDGIFENARGVLKRLQRCLLCGACEASCPGGVKCLEIFFKARSILSYIEGLPIWERVFLRKIFSEPERFRNIMNFLALCQPLAVSKVSSSVGTVHARIPLPFFKNRDLMPLAEKPFKDRIQLLDISQKAGQPRVAIFIGCLVDRIFPSVAESMVEVLKTNQVWLFTPEDQVCCGIPALSG